MLASGLGVAPKFMPIPTMFAVRASASGGAAATNARLNAMAEPPGKISQRVVHVRRPLHVQVLDLQPRHCLREFRGCRAQREAVPEVDAAIAECEQFHLEQIGAPERLELYGGSMKRGLEMLPPARRQHLRQLRGAIVEPLVVERITAAAQLRREITRRAQHLGFERRLEDVAITRLARDDPEEVQCRSTDYDGLEAEAPRGEEAIERLEQLVRFHVGISINDTLFKHHVPAVIV